jgi:uncharacterized protein YeeX (DUF496 family)
MNNTLTLILGASIAIIGGFIGDEFRSYRERQRERKAIKISIIDELEDIMTIIKNMHEVWEKSKLLHPSYVADLLASTSIYESFRTRLFLIKEAELRKELNAFYKKLKDLAHKSEGKLGSLADTPEASTEQSGFDAAFQALGSDAKTIKEKLEN